MLTRCALFCALLTSPLSLDAELAQASPADAEPMPASGQPADAVPEPARATLDRARAPTHRAAAAGWEPAPFQARYRARYDGVPFSAKGRRLLLRGEDGELRFFSDLRAMFLQVTEEAHMQLDGDGALRPVRYEYRQRGIGGRRDRYLDFDWPAGEVRRSGDKSRVEPLGEGYLDPVSWQLALRRDVSSGTLATGDVVEYPITDGGEAKTYAIKLRGPEALELPVGRLETVKLERIFGPGDARETRIWLAPEYDYMLVRLEAVDDSGRMLRLELLEPPEPA
ncbi:MAG: DUF3108 domain-containing protein [Pseudomonadales bacterium]|nr:DUF3108 domain-containing protein [Pseudomonadales bacterium]